MDMNGAVPERFCAIHEEETRAREQHNTLDGSHAYGVDAGSETWTNDWALTSSFHGQVHRQSGAITWATAVHAEQYWTDAAKALLKSLHQGQVHGMQAMQRRLLLGETDAQRLVQEQTFGFNPWDAIPLDLELMFQQDSGSAR